MRLPPSLVLFSLLLLVRSNENQFASYPKTVLLFSSQTQNKPSYVIKNIIREKNREI